jgi:hypothetical protein
MNKSIKSEIEELEHLNQKQLKQRLLMYKVLYYSNTEEFSFYWSLFFGLIPLFFFGSWLYCFMALLFHYFIYWKQIHPLLDKKYNSEKEREEILEIIDHIKVKLNK